MPVTRRGILIGALATGGLAVGYLVRPRAYPLPLAPGADEFAFDAWITIGRDGVVTVAVPQVEMGQGVTTLLPQIVAHELGADWRQVEVEPAPVSPVYANLALAAKWAPLWFPLAPSLAPSLAGAPDDLLTRRWAEAHRFTITADGTELAGYEAPARAAAASARVMLALAAAKRWGTEWTQCEVHAGFVTLAGKRLAFGELAEEAATYSPPVPPPLRLAPMSERPPEFPPGAALRYPRLDLPSKVDGSWTFAGDIRLPGLLYAAIRHAPIAHTSTLAPLDEQAAKDLRGVLRVVRGTTQGTAWVAAVARDGWSAETALTRMAPRFAFAGPADSAQVDTVLDEAMRAGKRALIHTAGDEAQARGALPVQIRYEVASAVHATIETASATARLSGGRLELWIGTQAPEAARQAAAQAIGLRVADVVLYPVAIGGSFDRRLEVGHAAQVAVLAKEMGAPVQLTWSRAEELRAGFPRAPVVAVMAARTDAEGNVAGWRARIAAQSSAREFGRRLFDGDAPFDALAAVAGTGDAMAVEGAVPPYAIPNLAIDHIAAAPGLPSARMRGNAHGYTAFFTESFVDELAHKAGREPLSYRMAMLGGNPRLAECLQRVAQLAQWGGGSDSSGQGIACHQIGTDDAPGSGEGGGQSSGGGAGRIAVVASARRDANGVRVDKLSAVVDIGRIVNVDIARQQIEGGLIFGLGLVLGCSVRYDRGRPDAETLAAMSLPALADCPAIEVAFIESEAEPASPGELGVAAVAPAVANALFSATGLRFRRLPLFSEDA